MKTIKFRAWDKLDKSMYNVREIDFLADGSINSIRTVVPYQTTNEDIDFDFPIRRDGEYELMQFTGLLDKNDKEIYEGDIVKYKGGYYYEPDETSISKVEYELCNFTPLDAILLQSSVQESELEIIGNIYENPELLK